MVFLSVLLVLILCSELQADQGPDQGPALNRWDIHCSQGLQCKTKPFRPFPPPCRSPPEGVNGLSVFQNVSLSTALRCQGRQRCALHLSVSATLLLTEAVHGLSICILTPGMVRMCKKVSFSKSSRRRMEGSLVQVESECVEISPGQEGKVTIQPLPQLCECSSSDDLQSRVSQCITGRLQYELQPDGRGLTVAVSDMLEDRDYRLRLCLQDFVCSGTGAVALIKKEEMVKKVFLPFSRPLPCLCIEGWSAVMDAPRVRVCPFKDRVAELWFGVTFDPLEAELSWQPACPVDVEVSLCTTVAGGKEGECDDLPRHTHKTTRSSKVTFSEVDPHPGLCVKVSLVWSCDFMVDTRWKHLNEVPDMIAASDTK
ncbi:hypothetical protein NHX12_020952 [Muraenolepis orangiensis]|uniref:Interleukin-17 receptor C/E N-terminal domain-containing protein n=1 Tax=Muraenolepis orangiensis TaxID=630683 RepID=A0A9Q0ITG6_9TELE|nr:hypothetical protein NHX12_020952 [Muraenolepis orangiensis]